MIAAPAERVWRHLVDFAGFQDWNPTLRSVRGRTAAGELLRVEARLPSGVALTFRPRLVSVEPGRELRWVDRTAVPGILEGDHSFVIEPLGPATVRFVQFERFRGLAALLFGPFLDRQIRPAFEAMNRTLKEVVERDGAAG